MAVDRKISITATFLSLKSKIYTKIFNGGKFEYGRRKIRTNSNIHEKKKSTKIAIDRNAKLPLIALTPFFSLKSKRTKIFDGGKFKYGRRKICIDPREARILY